MMTKKKNRRFPAFAWALVSLAPHLASAAEFQKILTCENGAVVVDVDAKERRNLQVVFRGEDLLRKMRDAGFADPRFGDREFVISGKHAELRQTSPTTTYPRLLNGVFYPGDFRKMIADYSASAIEVERMGDGLALRLLMLRQGTACPDPWDIECRGGVEHRTYQFIREYVLHGCSET